jgi:hypothetical protein
VGSYSKVLTKRLIPTCFSTPGAGRVPFRILIDTNIIIGLEDDKVLEDRFTDFCRVAQDNGQLLIHPKSVEDIQRDKDPERQKRTLSKLKKYPQLNQPPEPDKEFFKEINAESENDRVDGHLLFSMLRNAVHFLVTEDYGMHRKAKSLNIHENVLTIDQACSLFSHLSERYIPPSSNIEHGPIHDISIEDHFFDSLREDYPGFEDWYREKSKEGRECWTLKDRGRLLALCMYKEEKTPDSLHIPSPTLKLCTLKISDEVGGRKISELFLKLAFQYAEKNNLNSIYLTVLPKHEILISKLYEYGFTHVDNKGQEWIMMKPMNDAVIKEDIQDPVQYAIRFYPRFKDSWVVKKYIVPIQPQFHDRLFPDYTHRQSTLIEYGGTIPEGRAAADFLGLSPEGNTIKKAYICNAVTRQIEPGDVLLFYRSHDVSAITDIGIAEKVIRSNDPLEVASIVSNRTVYSFHEIEEIARGDALVIIFRHIGKLNTVVNLSTLASMGIKGSPQSIRSIPNVIYTAIKEAGR